MYVIIIGCGRVGSTLASLLSGEGSNVVIIDTSTEKLQRLEPQFTGETMIGDGTDISTLEEAKIKEADAFVAATGDDNSNLMSAQIAKSIFNVNRVLVRIKAPDRLDVYKQYDMETVSATTLAAYKLAEMLKTGREIEILDRIGKDKAKIVKFELPTAQACTTLMRMIESKAFNPSIVYANGKITLGAPEKLVPGAIVAGSILTEDMKRLKRLFKGKKS